MNEILTWIYIYISEYQFRKNSKCFRRHYHIDYLMLIINILIIQI